MIKVAFEGDVSERRWELVPWLINVSSRLLIREGEEGRLSTGPLGVSQNSIYDSRGGRYVGGMQVLV